MASETFSSIMLDVVENNRRVAHALVGAYREGGTKLIDRSLSGRFGARGRMISALMIEGTAAVADGAEAAVTSVFGEISRAVAQLGEWAADVDNPYATRYLQLLGAINLPMARAARTLSGELASRVGQWCGGSRRKQAVTIARRPAKLRRPRRRA